MKMTIQVNEESARKSDDGKMEFLSIIGTEVGPHPMQQFIEFSLSQEDAHHKGKLQGSQVEVWVKTAGDVFQHKARFGGKVLSVSAKK